MKILRHPIVLIWFIVAIIAMIVSVLLSYFAANSPFWVITAILMSQAASSIFFPILVGYFYDTLKEKESGDIIWQVFKDFSEGGIIRVYKDRELSESAENAEVDLRRAFESHADGEVKLIGVSLRVFFNQTGPFYRSILHIALRAQQNRRIRIKALVSHPDSPEVKCRAEIETPQMLKEPLIRRDILTSIANMQHINDQFEVDTVEYGYYSSCPYCTLVVFPDKCYFSPNLLSTDAPVRLPMIVFKAGSHGYEKLNYYFDYLWARRTPVEESLSTLSIENAREQR
jgi:hypothetical protein